MSVNVSAVVDEVLAAAPPLAATFDELDAPARARVERHAAYRGVSVRESLAELRVADMTRARKRADDDALTTLVSEVLR